MKCNFHTHTYYCDGADAPEDIVLTAIEKGFDCLGFSGHSYTYFDESYCMLPDNVLKYAAETRMLADKYADRITILTGIEQDYWSEEPTDAFDYVIGSVHYVKKDGAFLPVDESAEMFAAGVNEHYGGDVYAFAADYFKTVSDVVRRTNCNLIGHFDLISKFNAGGKMFDESDPRYTSAWAEAIESLIPCGVPFEVNTAPLYKLGKTEPYPTRPMLEKIHALGGKVALSSDSHSRDTLDAGFPEALAMLRDIGFAELTILGRNGAGQIPLTDFTG